MQDRPLLFSINNALGVIYGYQNDLRKTRQYFFVVKQLADQLGDKQKINLALVNLGDVYWRLQQLDSARYYTNQAYDLAVQRRDEVYLGGIHNNLGNIHAAMQQPTLALANYRMSLALFVATADNDGLCETTLGMASTFLQLHQPDSALHYAKLSFRTAQKTNLVQRMLNASTLLATYYRQQRRVDSAYVYLSAQLAAKDSLFSQEKSRQLQSLDLEEMLRQQEKQAALAEQQQQQQTNTQYAFIALVLSSFIVLLLLLTNSTLVGERWIRFFGVLGLLLLFEFLNLLFHGYVAELTHHSPALMLLVLLVLVALASLLIPLHHRIEHWVTQKMLARHKEHKLAAARKAAAWLAAEASAEPIA